MSTPLYSEQFSIFDDSCKRLLLAIGTPPDMRGAGLVLPVVAQCLRDAQLEWPLADLNSLILSIANAQSRLQALANKDPESALLFLQPPSTCSNIFAEIRSLKSHTGAPVFEQLSALTGRAIAIFSETETGLPVKFVLGIKALTNQAGGKGSRSADWQRVLNAGILSEVQQQELQHSLGPSSPTFGFLETLQYVLRTGIQLKIQPSSLSTYTETPETSNATQAKWNSERHASTTVDATTQQDSPEVQTDALKEWEADPTNVLARMAAANFSAPATKLGIPFRDYLLTADLALLTKNLVRDLQNTDPTTRGFSVLGLISMLTSASDMYALDILVSPKAGHIWLDLEFGAWCWDFAAYRTSNIQPSTELSIEPIVIPLPQSLVASLKAGYCTHGSARNLAEIICAIQGKDRVDLKQFRQYLRDIGDEAHPPYRGRLANSLAHAILEVTGSDMMSTLLTAQFPAVAPAALFYFGPTYQVVYQRLSQLYERLGLGNHTTPKPLDERTGGHRIPPNEVVLKGWILLVDRIEVERHQVSKARSFDEARIAVNTLMRYLCAAFIIQCGHRGSRLDQLSFGALASSDSFMVIHDKELNDQFLRAQPRLLPKTAIIRTVVEIALDCHSLMAKRSGLQDPKPRSLDTPAFAQFEGSEKIEVHPVHTRDVAGLIFEMFDGAPINFSRSVWVTSLDSFGCDRWLIRAFTGHARDITRTSGPFFDVPVTEAAKRLKDSMEAIGPKVFGDCAPTRSEKTCARKMQLPRIQGLEQARSKKQFPDPIATLIPVTQDILVAAELAKSLRSAIFNGSLATEPAESLLLHLLFVDLCPNTDVALLAVCEPPARFVEELVRPALKWDRDHFIHPVLLPLTSPSAQLLGILDDKKTTKSVLLSGLVRALQLVAGHHPEISTAEGIWENLSFWSQSFRRLYLPPSMLGCSHPEIPAPCLNLGSWQRLSGVFPKNLQVSAISPHTTKSTTYQKSSDVKELGKVLNHFSDSTLRLGEKRQRAIDAIKAINCIDVDSV